MKIGALSLGWSGKSLPNIFKTIASMGGECVDINGNIEKHHCISITHQTAFQIRDLAADAGLIIGSLTGYNDFVLSSAGDLDKEIKRLLETRTYSSRSSWQF